MDTAVTVEGGVQARPLRMMRSRPLLTRAMRPQVTCVDANHCPGAVQLLFQLPDGRRYIHSGDMRFREAMTEHPALCAARAAGVDGLFLDTTYCNPRCGALACC